MKERARDASVNALNRSGFGPPQTYLFYETTLTSWRPNGMENTVSYCSSEPVIHTVPVLFRMGSGMQLP